MGESSQKIWTYFSESEPVTLAVGQKLTASISFIPRKVLAEATSRSLRIGLFHDPTSPRVEDDVNNDGGGPGAPWTDAQGYAVQVLITGGEYSSTKPFDLGKRTNLASASLLGTSGDYTKMSGGDPVALELDKEYRVTLEITKVSDKQIDLTVQPVSRRRAAFDLQPERRRLVAGLRADLRQVRSALHPHRRQPDDGRSNRLHELQSRSDDPSQVVAA